MQAPLSFQRKRKGAGKTKHPSNVAPVFNSIKKEEGISHVPWACPPLGASLEERELTRVHFRRQVNASRDMCVRPLAPSWKRQHLNRTRGFRSGTWPQKHSSSQTFYLCITWVLVGKRGGRLGGWGSGSTCLVLWLELDVGARFEATS